MKVAYRIWLDNDGKAFGEGPYRLLKGIEKTGSLRKTTIEQGISYRKAWCMLKNIEKKLGFSVLERKVGGVSGGGSILTPSAVSFMAQYEQFRKDAKKTLDKLCRKHFPR